jgi:zinc transporter
MDTPGVKTVIESRGGLVNAFVLDGAGGGRRVEWPEINGWTPESGVLWVHLDRTSSGAQRWLGERAGLDSILAAALLEAETRPRVLAIGAGLLVILRGVNLNPGAEPEDMVSIRVWVEPGRIITSRHRRFPASQDMRDRITAGSGPRDAGEFLAQFAAATVTRIGPVVDALADEVDALEERLVEGSAGNLRRDLSGIRRRAIKLRRYLSPQRDAMARLMTEPAAWLSAAHRAQIREAADRVTRLVEDLDATRERAVLAQEELTSRLAEAMNRTMYVLSIVAALFLPLSFITGLLGVNVGGLPGIENEHAFWVLCGLLAVMIALQLAWFRRKGWM